MNLIQILYEPYVIIIILSLFITLIAYFIMNRYNNIEDDQNVKKNSNAKYLLYTFIISFLLLTLFRYIAIYMNNNQFFQKGSGLSSALQKNSIGKAVENTFRENLTIIDDDLDYGLLDN
jgi:H+/Cl- antiporter ClcA